MSVHVCFYNYTNDMKQVFYNILVNMIKYYMKRQLKRWWTIIPPLSTKGTMTCNLKQISAKTTATYDVKNPDPGLGLKQKCGGAKQYTGIPSRVFWLFNLQRQYIYLFLPENMLYTNLNSMTYEFASSLRTLNKWRLNKVHL